MLRTISISIYKMYVKCKEILFVSFPAWNTKSPSSGARLARTGYLFVEDGVLTDICHLGILSCICGSAIPVKRNSCSLKGG